jgi:hypothetical protein
LLESIRPDFETKVKPRAENGIGAHAPSHCAVQERKTGLESIRPDFETKVKPRACSMLHPTVQERKTGLVCMLHPAAERARKIGPHEKVVSKDRNSASKIAGFRPFSHLKIEFSASAASVFGFSG